MGEKLPLFLALIRNGAAGLGESSPLRPDLGARGAGAGVPPGPRVLGGAASRRSRSGDRRYSGEGPSRLDTEGRGKDRAAPGDASPPHWTTRHGKDGQDRYHRPWFWSGVHPHLPEPSARGGGG